jgi:hypothetical protein
MSDSVQTVRHKLPPPRRRGEIHGEHLVFLRSDGSLAALPLLEVVEELVGMWLLAGARSMDCTYY